MHETNIHKSNPTSRGLASVEERREKIGSSADGWGTKYRLLKVYPKVYMGVSENSGTPKTPQNDHF